MNGNEPIRSSNCADSTGIGVPELPAGVATETACCGSEQDQLRGELARERRFLRRQELLKRLWRLENQGDEMDQDQAVAAKLQPTESGDPTNLRRLA